MYGIRRNGPTLSVLLAMCLFACADESTSGGSVVPATFLERAPEACQSYGSDSEVFGYCMVNQVALETSPEDAAAHCSMTGSWETRCRHRWVSVQRGDATTHSTSVLLDFCGEDSECAFELLEFRSVPDLDSQIGLCVTHTGTHVEDCIGHAVQRWWQEDPTEDELMAGARLEMPFPDKMGYFLAASIVCDGVGACEGAQEDVRSRCLHHVDTFRRNPDSCPSKEKAPMHGDNPDNFIDGGAPAPSEDGPADERRSDGNLDGENDALMGEGGQVPSGAPQNSIPTPDGLLMNSVPTPMASPPPEIELVPQESPPPVVPDPGPNPLGGGLPVPDPSTHGHVPDGVPGGGTNPPPPRSAGER